MDSGRLQEPVLDINRWFTSEVSRWKSGAALVWTILLTGPVVCGVLGAATVDVWHPLTWISDVLLNVFSMWKWNYMLIIIVMVAILTVQHAKRRTVMPTVHLTRWERIRSVCRLWCVYSVVMTSCMCAVMVWCYIRLLNNTYRTLSVSCSPDSQDQCLNEPHLYLVMHGFYVGMIFRMSSFTGNSHMIFPIIQQAKFFQLKSSVWSMIWTALFLTFNRLKYFIMAYFFVLGYLVKGFLVTNVGLPLSESISPVDSLTGLLDLPLYWHCILSGGMVHLLLALGSKIHQLYLTEWYQFPVETSGEQNRNLCLANALRCEQNHLLQYHGYQHLYLLSKHSSFSRRQLFSLTQLGGHPQNWQLMFTEVSTVLQRLIEEIAAYNTAIMANGSMKQLNADKNQINGDLRQRQQSNGKPQTSQAKPSIKTSIVNDLKKNRLVAYFFSEDEDARSRKLFAKAQLYIWASEALSYLVCASYDEDKFGVVQKSLPKILSMLLSLQENVEKHLRLVPIAGKQSDDEHDSDATLRNAFKVTLKGSIYRIVSRFGPHIRSVSLPNEHMRRLGHFLDFKE